MSFSPSLLYQVNPRFSVGLLRNSLRILFPNARGATAFREFVAREGLEFTNQWADDNIPFLAPVLGSALADRQHIKYLEIGVYEGRMLAFMHFLLGRRLEATVIDPWGGADADTRYLEIERRFRRNLDRMGSSVQVLKGLSWGVLPELLEAEKAFDLIYLDGNHLAWAVYLDLCLCLSLLKPGGLIVIDDYWRVRQHGHACVKRAVDDLYGAFREHLSIVSVYRQVVLRLERSIPTNPALSAV
jgi:predicted O-methyltransferase YrrM